MSGYRPGIDAIARSVVAITRHVRRHQPGVSLQALFMTLLVAVGYLTQGALGRQSPLQRAFSVRILLSESGGLLPNQDVTFRGQPVGRIASVAFDKDGVVAIARIDTGVRIPANSLARVSALSPAGEQHLDFRPQGPSGEILTDGAVIGRQHTTVPVSLAELLGDAGDVLDQLDTAKLAAITDELRVSRQAPQKLADILDGGSFLISTLESVLPETVSAIRNSRVFLTTLGQTSDGLHETARDLHSILEGAATMDRGFRTLVDVGPAPLKTLDALVADNSDTMVQLLGNLTTIAPLFRLREPALRALFPTTRGSLVESVNSMIHDGGIWGLLDIYPRYSCDYTLPRRPPSVPDFVEPYRYTYCANPDPAVLVRGARNAPRPPGDDTAGPPPGYDPAQKTDPTPTGSHSIPTPYGGPQLPVALPNPSGRK